MKCFVSPPFFLTTHFSFRKLTHALLLTLIVFYLCFAHSALAGLIRYRLNGPIVTWSKIVVDFSISPDGRMVVSRANHDTADVIELYSVLVSGGDVWDYSISPDSSRVVYMAEQDTAGALELFGVYDSSYHKYNILFFIPPVLSGL